MQSLQKTGSSEYGEVFIGTTGKKTLVMNVVRVVTGVKEEACREDTLYTFLFDMCPELRNVKFLDALASLDFTLVSK